MVILNMNSEWMEKGLTNLAVQSNPIELDSFTCSTVLTLTKAVEILLLGFHGAAMHK